MIESAPNIEAANYRTVLPDTKLLQKDLETPRRLLKSRTAKQPKKFFAMVRRPGVQPSGSRAAPRASCRVAAIRL